MDRVDESVGGITDNDELTCSYLAYGEKVCLAYLSGSNVKFAYIPVAPQISYFQVGVSDISVSGKYVKASPSSPLNTANITVRIYHNVDNNST